MQGLLKKEEETEVEVRWEDQKKINEFGRNNAKLDELRDDMKKIQVCRAGMPPEKLCATKCLF
jgi:hypothetical protein